MEVTVSDRTLVSVGLARPVSGSREHTASVSDRTLGHKLTGRWKAAFGPTDVSTHSVEGD